MHSHDDEVNNDEEEEEGNNHAGKARRQEALLGRHWETFHSDRWMRGGEGKAGHTCCTARLKGSQKQCI